MTPSYLRMSGTWLASSTSWTYLAVPNACGSDGCIGLCTPQVRVPIGTNADLVVPGHAGNWLHSGIHCTHSMNTMDCSKGSTIHVEVFLRGEFERDDTYPLWWINSPCLLARYPSLLTCFVNSLEALQNTSSTCSFVRCRRLFHVDTS